MVSSQLNEEPRSATGRALLDTTVQLDRKKYGSRKEKLEIMLSTYELTFATSLSLVEFKATIIEQCITIHNQLRAKGARYTRARDALLEKDHRQQRLRTHIFNNLLDVFARSSFEITQSQDELLAEKARLQLENVIPELFRWFREDSVDAILKEKLRCDRAREAPYKMRAAFTTNLPDCRRGHNKTCCVESLIRAEAPALIERLKPKLGEPDDKLDDKSEAKSETQLQKAVKVFESVIKDPKKELSVGDCRKAGDCLIAIEASGSVTHALSSNAREWKPISEALDLEFVPITFPEERTRS
jgi:hypothetical protein